MNALPDLDLERVGPYLIHSRREILGLLLQLADLHSLVRMIFRDGEEAVATSILAADENGVTVDSIPNLAELRRVLASTNISFDTSLDRVRIAFFAASIEAVHHDGHPALRIALPDNVVRLQRREYYRVMSPRCSVRIPRGNGHAEVSFEVQNVSAGGIGLVDTQQEIDTEKGAEYVGCELALPGAQSVTVTLMVMNCFESPAINGRTVRRIGCAFVNPTAAMLTVVQRYVSKLERDQRGRRNT